MDNNVRFLAENTAVSNDTRLTGLNNNDLIIGSSGSGKTGGYVIPNIQGVSGSLVVTDTKGQLSGIFSDRLRSRGCNVSTLNFVDPENPADTIRSRRYAASRTENTASRIFCRWQMR